MEVPMPAMMRLRARNLRRALTPSEKRLWVALRGRRFAAIKFGRQHIIGKYIVDFCCLESKVIVELDGDSHVEKELADKVRQTWLENEGYRVMRFWDPEIYTNFDKTLELIHAACCAPSPSEGRGPT